MKQLALILVLSTSTLLVGQNLVPNPSFEDTVSCPPTVCPTLINMSIYVDSWQSFGGTPDYYHVCSPPGSNSAGVPINAAGEQLANGNAYCGFMAWHQTGINPASQREIIATQLTNPLQTGVKYFISFNLSLATYYPQGAACNKVGVKFTNQSFNIFNPLTPDNSAHFFTNSIITDTTNWTNVSGTYVADSAYNYITIGNFFINSFTDTTVVTPLWQPAFAYYYIDDVCVSTDSLTCNSIATGIMNVKRREFIKIYPNPTTGNITIDLGKVKHSVKATLMNSLGQVMLTQNFGKTDFINLDINYPKGLYFLTLETQGEVITKKIVLE